MLYRKRYAASALLVAVVVASQQPPAQADHGVDNMYPTLNTYWQCGQLDSNGLGFFCRTDNSQVTYHAQSSLDATARSVIANIINGQYDPTDLTMTYQNPPAYTGTAETDIVFQATPLPGSLVGRAYCDDAATTLLCDQHYVQFHSSGNASDPTVPCHEIGHAVGLTHGNEAYPFTSNSATELRCLETPIDYNAQTLGPHNVHQINATW